MIACFVFAFAYMVKGGQLPITNGKALSTLMVFACVINQSHDLIMSCAVAAAWILAIAPSMGEEAGAIGRWGHAWGKYIDWMPSLKTYRVPKFLANNISTDPDGTEHYWLSYREGRWYGLNKGVQRGAWIGAIFSIALGHAALFVPVLAVGFVAAHFIGQELYFRIHKKDDWKYSEALLGALIGLCYHLSSGA